MPLNKAEKAQLAEIERRLTQEHPDLTHTFRERPRPSGAVTLLLAAGMFFATLAVLSALTGDVLPILLALPPVVVAVLLVRHQDALRARLADEPPSARDPGHDQPAA